MMTRLSSTLLAAFVLLPLGALAQPLPTAGGAAPEHAIQALSPQAPGTQSMQPAPGPDGDALAWFGDALLGLDLGDELGLFAEGPGGEPEPGAGDAIADPPGPAGDDDAAWHDGGPGGAERLHRALVHGGPGARLMLRRHLAMRLAGLDLTAAQRERLRDLHEGQARKAIQRRADMALARLDLHRLMRADKVDAAAVNAQIDKLARLHAEAMKSAFETHMLARAVLTPDQLEKLRNGPGPGSINRHLMDGEPHAPKP